MKNDNSSQSVLPFMFDQELKPNVKQAYKITFSAQKRVSVYAKRIVARVLSEIKDTDTELKPFYRFHITEITHSDIESDYKRMKVAFLELASLSWLIEDIGNDEFHIRHLLNTTSRDINCGYKKGYITVAINPALTDHFIQISHYTRYQLDSYMNFQSWNSMRLYEMLSAVRDTGIWKPSIEGYRRFMDCEKKYPTTTHLLKRTTEKPLKELAETDMAFTVDKRYKAREYGETGRRKVIGFTFKLLNWTPKQKLSKWNQNPKLKPTLDALKNIYKVEDKNIARYAESIGIKGINNLMSIWRAKNESEDPIKDCLAYCNKAFCEVGVNSQISRKQHVED